MEIKELETLKKNLDAVNSKIATINGKKESLKSQLVKILQAHGVKTPKELNEKYLASKENAEAVAKEVEQFIADSNAKIEEIEKLCSEAEQSEF